MNIYKVSLGDGFFTDSTYNKIITNNLISVHPDTAAKGQSSTTQGQQFLDAKKGDLFYICRSNNSVELLGMFIDNRPLYSIINGHDDWADRQFITIAKAINKTAYDKGFDNGGHLKIIQHLYALIKVSIVSSNRKYYNQFLIPT